MLAWSEIRRRWRSVVVLTLLVGVVGAVVMATVAGARRTDSALARFITSSRAATVQVMTGFGRPTAQQLRAFGRVPNVSAFAAGEGFFIVVPDAPNLSPVVAVDTKLGTVVDQARIVAGRAADPSAVDEITIGENLAAQLHRAVGGHLDAVSYTPDQVAAILGGATDPGPPAGPRLRFRIVGIARRPADLGRKGALGGVLALTPAFDRKYSGQIGSFGSGLQVRTRNGAADVPQIKAAALRIFGPSPLFGVQSAAGNSAGTQNAIDVVVVALLIFAGVAALAGVVALGIVMTREVALVSVDQETLRALGLTRAQRVAMSGPQALLIAAGGALLAAAGAAAASPLFPIGVARRAEPDLGVHADWVVLALGVAVVVVVVVLIAFVAAIRATRPMPLEIEAPARRRTSTVPELAARAGMAPTATNGLRMALQPGRGRTAVPVRSAFLGAVFGVFGVIAVLVFASSLNHLVATPRLYGWTWDFSATDTISNNNSCSHDDFGLLQEPGVGALAVACYGTGNIQLDGHTVNGWSFTSLRGTIEPTVVAGHAPHGAHQVALGSVTMHTLGKHIGDTVRASGPNAKADYRIVGQVVFPTLSQPQPIADGAAFTGTGFAPLLDQDNYYRYLLGRFTPGVDRATVERRITAIPQLDPPATPTLPVEVDRLDQIGWFPATLAALLAGLALIAVGHALVTAVRRRRRELALLKTLGFNRHQVRSTVAWQATTLGTVGLVVGIPLGVIVGSLVWRLVADGLGISTTASIPTLAVLLTVPAVLALVNLIAYLPARSRADTTRRRAPNGMTRSASSAPREHHATGLRQAPTARRSQHRWPTRARSC